MLSVGGDEIDVGRQSPEQCRLLPVPGTTITRGIMPDDSRHAAILFADLVGSARLSDVMPPSDYDRIVTAFQQTSVNVAREGINSLNERGIPDRDVDIRGDQLVFIAVVPEASKTNPNAAKSSQVVAREVLKLAINLGIRWFLSKENQTRIDDGATPFQIGVGIHFGPVVYRDHSRFPSGAPDFRKVKTPEGFAINFGKRVESMSRFGHSSGIALSQSFVNLCKTAGFSLFLSNPLVGETKGFETREPIYELLGQELIPQGLQDIKALVKGRGFIQTAFRRDPERMRWMMEMLVEAMFKGGYNERDKELWQEGRELSLEAAQIVQKPAKFYFDAGRFAHKVGWHHGSDSPIEDELQSAIAYHRAALTDPSMQWAASDLAIVHTRFAAPYIEYDTRWKRKPSPESVSHHLEEACELGNKLVKRYPDHYYSYYVRAITSSVWIQWIRIAESHPSNPRGIDERVSKDLVQVERDLESMRLLNDKPMYLYYCVKAELAIAQENPELAHKALDCARQAVERIEEEEEELYLAGFLQKGVMVPSLRPPPRRSFHGRFAVTEKKIARLEERLG